jgi:hypothetical protein
MVYHYDCPEHGLFELILPLSEWDDKKACPQKDCGKIGEQVVLPARSSGEFSVPIVVHVAADGAIRFPGRGDARVPEGFERRELRTIREIEHFERQMNARLRSESDRHNSNEERHFSEIKAQQRSELRQRMQGMSEQGRDFARFAMRLNDSRKRKQTECGFHVEVLHFDQSNREAHSDDRTNWKRRHG